MLFLHFLTITPRLLKLRTKENQIVSLNPHTNSLQLTDTDTNAEVVLKKRVLYFQIDNQLYDIRMKKNDIVAVGVKKSVIRSVHVEEHEVLGFKHMKNNENNENNLTLFEPHNILAFKHDLKQSTKPPLKPPDPSFPKMNITVPTVKKKTVSSTPKYSSMFKRGNKKTVEENLNGNILKSENKRVQNVDTAVESAVESVDTAVESEGVTRSESVHPLMSPTVSALEDPLHPLNDPLNNPLHPVNDPLHPVNDPINNPTVNPLHPLNDPTINPLHPLNSPTINPTINPLNNQYTIINKPTSFHSFHIESDSSLEKEMPPPFLHTYLLETNYPYFKLINDLTSLNPLCLTFLNDLFIYGPCVKNLKYQEFLMVKREEIKSVNLVVKKEKKNNVKEIIIKDLKKEEKEKENDKNLVDDFKEKRKIVIKKEVPSENVVRKEVPSENEMRNDEDFIEQLRNTFNEDDIRQAMGD